MYLFVCVYIDKTMTYSVNHDKIILLSSAENVVCYNVSKSFRSGK